MTLAAGIAIRHVAETGSTNSDVLAEVRAEAADGAAFAPRLLVAARQTAGRGRHGRRWQGDGVASLTFSLAWPFASAADLSGLSLAVGVAIAEALDPAPAGASPAFRIGLKWPNDLCLVDAVRGDGGPPAYRKLAGILVETTPCGADRRVAVIGVGINVAAQAVEDAASGVAWLGEVDAPATPASALKSLLPGLVDALERFERDGFAAFVERFAARDLLRGRAVGSGGAATAGGRLEGVAAGVSASGEMLLETPGGVVPVRSGEVRLRPLAPAESLPC